MSDPIASRLAFMEFGAEQRETLRSTKPLVSSVIGKALDRFYTRAAATPDTAGFFADSAHMARAKAAQEKHWVHLASAEFDQNYYQSVRRIGTTHARIGLEPRWYVGSYAIVLEHLLRGVQSLTPLWKRIVGIFRPAAVAEANIAIVKAALLDMEISLSIYFEEAQSTRELAVARIDEALASLAQGDLTGELTGMPEGFAAVERSYNATLAKMRGAIGAINDGASRINSGVSEIAQASEDLARRTQSNAASLEETTAALSQMDGRLRNTATAAQSTVVRADQAIATVGDGRTVADFAVQAMGRVSESARGIDNVIEGVDKIAFQTRVLAMNAAVEAGRAGEAGRGFAVVADLVSALAMRAEEEAGRAREQLSSTQAEIESAVGAVRKVDEALGTISDDVAQVHALLGAMANDNSAQATAITQISTAVGTMDRGTQQNAAMVEETSAAARSLTSEVDTLAELTASFRTQGGQRKAPAPSHLGQPKQLSAAAVAALRHPHA
ncbi:methyl-accepting chemotaxis protein [Sphingomonas sp. IC-56]|uniref:methyl-accepting chemotaxis protein n=1 Tax=Sphingomonas sp. IC-56 TaxID=2898529 RepID=UPI0022AAF4B1|nr:globin-coupled sensor protein [Sphingomonas sp. IC-56]